jgi:hypothetical protein
MYSTIRIATANLNRQRYEKFNFYVLLMQIICLTQSFGSGSEAFRHLRNFGATSDSLLLILTRPNMDRPDLDQVLRGPEPELLLYGLVKEIKFLRFNKRPPFQNKCFIYILYMVWLNIYDDICRRHKKHSINAVGPLLAHTRYGSYPTWIGTG